MDGRTSAAPRAAAPRRSQALVAACLVLLGCAVLALLPAAAHATTCVWSPQTLGSLLPLYDVDFVDASNGWACGFGIYHTVDGGLTWQEQPTGTNEDYNGISFVDADHGWAVGQDATILHTTDGGQTWHEQTSAAIYPLYDVSFVDRDNGWTVGFQDVLHTTDGGATWTAQRSIGTSKAVTFTDARTGWATAGGGIVRTTNAGATWIQSWQTGAMMFDLSFPTATDGWAAGVEGKVFHTSDGGENWTLQETGVAGILYGVSFVDTLHGWACASGQIVRTEDGGETWVSDPAGTDMLAAIDVVDLAHGWAVGGNGNVLHMHAVAWDDPTVQVSGVPPGWEPAPVILRVSAGVDPALGLTHLEASPDDGATWSEVPGGGAERELVLMDDGEQHLTLRATDSRGTTATTTATVRIDATAPRSHPEPVTRGRARIRATATVPVRLAAADRSPGSGVASVAVAIVARSGKVVGRAQVSWTGGKAMRALVKVPRRLGIGRYSIRTLAMDDAGNAQATSGRATLTVR
jgi:photosystem II stability/assembly factor-like uncharacterized protein